MILKFYTFLIGLSEVLICLWFFLRVQHDDHPQDKRYIGSISFSWDFNLILHLKKLCCFPLWDLLLMNIAFDSIKFKKPINSNQGSTFYISFFSIIFSPISIIFREGLSYEFFNWNFYFYNFQSNCCLREMSVNVGLCQVLALFGLRCSCKFMECPN